MKNTMLFLAAALLLLNACNKDDDTVLQPHDQNQMMSIMHDMMNQMDTMQMTDDPEIDFPSMMIMHHQGAINMANLELQKGTNDSLKTIAQNIIDMQQMEITEFNTYLAANSVNNGVPDFSMAQMESMDKMGGNADVQFITGDIDNDFATLMIVHHQSALENSNAYLMYGNDDYLKTKANEMIEMQNMEIMELQNWLIANKR